MSFLAAIDYIMAGCGLKDALMRIYSELTADKILSGGKYSTPKKKVYLWGTLEMYLWSTPLWRKEMYTVVHATGTLAVPTGYTNAVYTVGSAAVP